MGFFESDKEKANKDVYNQIKGLDDNQFKSQNIFSNYKNPFGYKDKLNNLFKVYDNAIGTQQTRNAESLASQGITGGAILNQTNNNIASGVNSDFAGKNVDLMNQDNTDALNIAQLTNSEKQQEINNILKKYQLLTGAANSLDDTSGWDYVGAGLSGLGTVASAAGKFL